VVAHRSWPYTMLRASVFDEIFTYGIVTLRRTYLAYLGMMAGDDGG
jgi:hypothetical protein